jgi:hypothetical protein
MDDDVGRDPPGELGTVDGPDVSSETDDGEDVAALQVMQRTFRSSTNTLMKRRQSFPHCLL